MTEKNNLKHTMLPDEVITNKIYFIRSQKVMLDKDLAELYGVLTRNLNKAVKRNIKRFPKDFMFQLTNEEFNNLKFQFGTSSWGGTRKLPFVFTEQGVAMLSGILNSDRAINVNIQIMRVFTKIREMLIDKLELKLEIDEIKKKLEKQDKSIDLIFTYLDTLIQKQKDPKERNKAFGQYDHVRIYGMDFFDRLEEAGFMVEKCEYTSKFTSEEINKYCLPNREIIPVCRK